MLPGGALFPGLGREYRCDGRGQEGEPGWGQWVVEPPAGPRHCPGGWADTDSWHPPNHADRREDVHLPFYRQESDVTCPCHTSGNWQRRDTNPGSLGLGAVLTTAPHCHSVNQSTRRNSCNLSCWASPYREPPLHRVAVPWLVTCPQEGPSLPPEQHRVLQGPPDRSRPTSGFSWLGGWSSFFLVA